MVLLRAPGNKWALDQAKRHLADSYFLVGVSEEMEKFIHTLEYTIPDMFTGATKKYMKGKCGSFMKGTFIGKI